MKTAHIQPFACGTPYTILSPSQPEGFFIRPLKTCFNLSTTLRQHLAGYTLCFKEIPIKTIRNNKSKRLSAGTHTTTLLPFQAYQQSFNTKNYELKPWKYNFICGYTAMKYLATLIMAWVTLPAAGQYNPRRYHEFDGVKTLAYANDTSRHTTVKLNISDSRAKGYIIGGITHLLNGCKEPIYTSTDLPVLFRGNFEIVVVVKIVCGETFE